MKIKFRLWNVATETMFYSDSPSVAGCSIGLDGCLKGTIPGYTGQFLLDDENFVLLEYTGFKDKNGKQIYEGDVLYLKFWHSPSFSLDACPEEEHILVSIPEFFMYSAGDDIVNSLCGEEESLEEFVKNYEIVGNIWQNPELKRRVENNENT